MKRINKSTLLAYHNCPRLAHPAISESKDFTGGDIFMRQGVEVSIKAAEFFGADITIDGGASAEDAARLTEAALNEGKLVAEATFIGTDAIVRCDLARRDENGVAFTEVKSSTYKQDNIEKNVNDVAAQVALLERIGHRVVRAELALLNSGAVGPDAKDLFIAEDITARAIGAVRDLDIDEIIAEISAPSPLPRVFCEFCRKCDFLHKCWPEYPGRHATVHIPRMKYSKLEQLHNGGIFEGRDVDESLLSKTQKPVVACWRKGKPELDIAGFERNFSDLLPTSQRLHFLDIEAAMPPIPLFAEHNPYTLVPFQFSLHTATFTGEDTLSEERHKEFLHLDKIDPTPYFLDALIGALSGDNDKIVVYSHFEKTGINAAVQFNPEFAEKAERIVGRFVDLEKAVSQNLFHPATNGKSGIKSVLPAFKPEYAYDNLGVQEGMQAVDSWLALREQATPDAQTKIDLLEYCKRDTGAMIYVLEGILRLRSGRKSAVS